jgi:hypothetical protein
MSPKKTLVLALIALPLAGCVALPEYHGRDHEREHRPPPVASVDAVQEQQRRQIQMGARSGELTREEVRHLEAEQAAIRKEEQAYRSDGRVTERELAELRREQGEAARNIRREANDAQDVNPPRR